MTIRRRSLRKVLVLVGCLVGSVAFPGAAIGGVLILLGAALHLWSKGCLEQNRRLTTAGPYRFTRNPFYLANFLIDLGLCFVIGQVWVAVVFLPIWAFSYRDTIAREEERLAGLFPEEFEAYQAHVPVLFPTGRAWPADRVTGAFSLNNAGLARGAEYARVLGLFISPAAVWAADVVRRLGTGILNGDHDPELILCLMLPALWGWKLALAETFRRPETRLIPFRFVAKHRRSFLIGLALAVASLAATHPWASLLPLLWLGIVSLDGVGEARCRHAESVRVMAWPYFPWIAVGSLGVCALTWVLLTAFA